MDEKKIEEVMALVASHAHYFADVRSLREAEADSYLVEETYQQSKAVFNAIESKIRELVPVWLPIESAPKDGSWIQLWRAPEAEIGVRSPLVIARWSSEDGDWIWPTGAYDPFTERGIERANEDIDAGDCFYSLEFTHWMPLQKDPV